MLKLKYKDYSSSRKYQLLKDHTNNSREKMAQVNYHETLCWSINCWKNKSIGKIAAPKRQYGSSFSNFLQLSIVLITKTTKLLKCPHIKRTTTTTHIYTSKKRHELTNEKTHIQGNTEAITFKLEKFLNRRSQPSSHNS